MTEPPDETAREDQPETPLSPDVLEAAVATFERIAADRTLLVGVDEALRTRMIQAAGRVARPDRDARKQFVKAQRRARRAEKRAKDEATLGATGIRKKRADPVYITPKAPPMLTGGATHADRALPAELELGATDGFSEHEAERRLIEKRVCYVCKSEFDTVHHFYDQMCGPCGDFNFAKRSQTADLRGRWALLTGGRLKIGYQAGILLLRAGANLVVTTRFPNDAAARYANEPDFAEWGDRLHIHGLDLRHTPSVEAFAAHLCETLPHLDYIVHNACQTVRRAPGFYAHLLDAERKGPEALPAGEAKLVASHHTRSEAVSEGDLPALLHAAGLHDAPGMSQLELVDGDQDRGEHLYPTGALDQDLQQVDLRDVNSWRLRLADVPTVELLEVQLVNAIAPFVLNARLKPLMMRTETRDKHIVNVSAMEGQFYRAFKTDKHPHTNMAKAALNMMTRTSAIDYVRDGIHMNSVDTGWVSDEDPLADAQRKREIHRFHPPLDIVDGAARIIDPIFVGANTGEHVFGQFLKDYRSVPW